MKNLIKAVAISLVIAFIAQDIAWAYSDSLAAPSELLQEEIQEEALVRNLGGFLRFLTLTGDENGNVINYSNIARETGTSYHTVKESFQILEDTLVGFF